MQMTDSVVSGWLDGSDNIDGYGNPAGPLYIQGEAATVAALTGPEAEGIQSLRSETTCSGLVRSSCFCC